MPNKLIPWFMWCLAISLCLGWEHGMIVSLGLLFCAATECIWLLARLPQKHTYEEIDYVAVREWNQIEMLS